MSRAKILTPDFKNIALAAAALRRGEVVGMPTETVYGLAGNALNPQALAQIFQTKERPTFDPLIVHIGPPQNPQPPNSQRTLEDLDSMGLIDLTQLPASARKIAQSLMNAFWPGPLTLVLPKKASVPDLCTSGLPAVAIRMPQHPVAQELICAAGVPLAAPSANRFGRISPTSAQAVLEELGDRIDFILDGGASRIGVESTVIEISRLGAPRLLRPGGLARSEIEKVVGIELQTGTTPGRIEAPGMLESHYAPVKLLYLLPAEARLTQAHQLRDLLARSTPDPLHTPLKQVGLMILSGDPRAAGKNFSALIGCPVICRSLSVAGDRSEIARNLFATLREMDAQAVDVIFSETCRMDPGLGHAIADRLQRASARRNLNP